MIHLKPIRLLILLTAAALAGLAGVTGCTARVPERPIVTVSIEPQKYILEQITGDRIDVRCLLGNGGNPENYDPTVTHLMNVEKSLAYMRIGNIGFEDAIIDKVKALNPGLAIFNTADSIKLIRGSHGDHEATDPHTWTSIKNARIIARNMLNAMISVDPAHRKSYEKNFNAFSARLDSLDRTVDSVMAPHRGEAFLVWHPSLSYFARDYGLEQITLGDTEGKEISAVTLKQAVDSANSRHARVFFTQKLLDSRQAAALSDMLDARVVDINPLDYNWQEQILTVVNALTAGDKPADNSEDNGTEAD